MKEPTRSLLRLLLPPNPRWSLPRLRRFWRQRRAYTRLSGQRTPYCDLMPQLDDRSATTPIGYYFYQDTWAFRQVALRRPPRHVDVGSTALLVGCLAGILPTISVDIRPLQAQVPGLTYMTGSILNLPFEDDSVESLSSLCVIEHVGLGRYGDPLDPEGSAKAGRELARVLKPEGDLYVSVPMGKESRVVFNAHRIFSEADALGLFPRLTLREFALIGNGGFLPSLSAAAATDFPVGLFRFAKPPV